MAVHKELLRLGYNSYIAYLPEFIEEEIPFNYSRRKEFESTIDSGDLIVLQKIKNPINLKLFSYFKQLGVKLILIDCDLPIAMQVAKEVDQVICTSKTLRDKYLKLDINAAFIEDSPERYFKPELKRKKGKLECFWFGDNTLQKWSAVSRLEQILKDTRLTNWKLVTVSNHPGASIQWSPDFLATLKRADVIGLPIETESEESRVKSANRLLQSMALSVPVICSPLPSFIDIVSQGRDAIICSSDEEWIVAFKKLEDETIREQIGKQAFETSQKFSLEKSIRIWIKEFNLGEEFKIENPEAMEKTQEQFNDFFYRLLLNKNLFYWKKMAFSFKNLLWLISCASLKLRKRISV
jgi:glycosyltransferase involved in cell wall biosynthesis